ncbi:MAG: TMEM165/GDT1 family protein [Acidimicrobiales bacterium]
MPIGVALTVFAVIFVAELPDKTMIAALIMGGRSRPVLVWFGATLAFSVQVAVAVAVGQVLHLLPHPWIEGVSAALFAGGAAYLFFVPEHEEEAVGESAGESETPGTGLKTIGTAFVVIFVAEFGDLTQVLTANLAAREHQPVAVFIGALAALSAVIAIGAFSGRALLRVVSLAVVRKVGGVLLAGFAIYTVASLIAG